MLLWRETIHLVKSMTGYGRARETRNGRDITVEVRSVNNRYLDVSVKMPRNFIFAEDAVKAMVQRYTSRGKVDVFVTVDASAADVTQVSVNRELAAQYAAALNELAEVCGDTLVCHIEKALPRYEGVYPFIVQSFAAAFSPGLSWINREDDAGDRGLRTSKLQYLPAFLGAKVRVLARNELSPLETVPVLKTERLILDGLREEDKPLYNRLCLDDERNRWWGYDYREDLEGELTEEDFLSVAREDFQKKQAVNFAIRLDGRFIGEAVIYRFDYKGGAELGCRILPEYAGNGYGAEAFRRAAEWSLYQLGLYRLRAKCFHENEASRRMLAACMRPDGEDETFLYFEKRV